jgi:hypothetical protein
VDHLPAERPHLGQDLVQGGAAHQDEERRGPRLQGLAEVSLLLGLQLVQDLVGGVLAGNGDDPQIAHSLPPFLGSLYPGMHCACDHPERARDGDLARRWHGACAQDASSRRARPMVTMVGAVPGSRGTGPPQEGGCDTFQGSTRGRRGPIRTAYPWRQM